MTHNTTSLLLYRPPLIRFASALAHQELKKQKRAPLLFVVETGDGIDCFSMDYRSADSPQLLLAIAAMIVSELGEHQGSAAVFPVTSPKETAHKREQMAIEAELASGSWLARYGIRRGAAGAYIGKYPVSLSHQSGRDRPHLAPNGASSRPNAGLSETFAGAFGKRKLISWSHIPVHYGFTAAK